MPYYRRNYRRRNYRRPSYRRRNYHKKSSSSYLSTASKALAVAYGVKNLLNVEKKFVDFTVTGNPSDSSPITTLVNGCAQDDTDQTRDGGQVKWVYLNYRWQADINASASSTTLRCLVVKKKDTAGADADISEILDATGADVAAMYNRNTIFNYQVLYDRRFVLNTDKPSMIGHFKKKVGFRTRFSGTLATVSSIQKNGLFVIWVSNQPTNTPTISGVFRCNFVDN